MGWKCPTCGQHVYGGGKCPNCNPRYCEICGIHRSKAEMHRHHVSYSLGITVILCDTCHEKVHFPERRGSEDNDYELDRLNPMTDRGRA